MKKIAIAMLAILIAKSCLSQIELAIQAGPSINSLGPDQELAEFYSEFGTKTGILFGYSAGAMASIRKGMAIVKSGILIDSRGGSYYTNTMAVMTDEMGVQKSKHISLEGYSRLGYITMPLSIGFEIGKKTRLGMDIGGFISIPISEYHETTYEGTSSEFKPMFPIGRDAGFMANACAKIPLSNSISISTDFRYLHGMARRHGQRTDRTVFQPKLSDTRRTDNICRKIAMMEGKNKKAVDESDFDGIYQKFPTKRKIDAGIGAISIYGFYDEGWKSWRYSWSCQMEGCCMGSGGYMDDNSVAYPTEESAICAMAGQDMALRRDMKMKIMLEI